MNLTGLTAAAWILQGMRADCNWGHPQGAKIFLQVVQSVLLTAVTGIDQLLTLQLAMHPPLHLWPTAHPVPQPLQNAQSQQRQ
jgi:hypothetical protein